MLRSGSLLLVVFSAVDVHAATYYERNGGSDSADGRSHATAWATLGKVNDFSFSAGDVVLLHEGDTWKGQKLVVDWGGTSSAHAIVGAYCIDGSTPRRGYKTARPRHRRRGSHPDSLRRAGQSDAASRSHREHRGVQFRRARRRLQQGRLRPGRGRPRLEHVRLRHRNDPLQRHADRMPSSVFANNILLSISPGTKDVSGTASGSTARNNYYSQGDPGGIYSHSGNRYSGIELAKMSGWRNIRNLDDVSWRDFAPLASSATNGAGDSSHLASADEKHTFELDFNGLTHSSPIDMGGLRFSDSLQRTPKGPTLIDAAPQ